VFETWLLQAFGVASDEGAAGDMVSIFASVGSNGEVDSLFERSCTVMFFILTSCLFSG
jgi:hypothetical protein